MSEEILMSPLNDLIEFEVLYFSFGNSLNDFERYKRSGKAKPNPDE